MLKGKKFKKLVLASSVLGSVCLLGVNAFDMNKILQALPLPKTTTPSMSTSLRSPGASRSSIVCVLDILIL